MGGVRRRRRRGARSLVLYTLGTGIGGGIVLNDEVWLGAKAAPSRLGHMEVVPGGPPCPCGQIGCLELYASGNRGRDVLLSPDYAAQRRALIRSERAGSVQRDWPEARSGTVYLCAVEERGTRARTSARTTCTGSCRKGLALRCRTAAATSRSSRIIRMPSRAGKRPYHTIISGMLTGTDGTLWGPFGVMGGFMQPQGHVQVVTALVDDAAEPQEALDRPRFCIEPVGAAGSRVLLEGGVPRPRCSTACVSVDTRSWPMCRSSGGHSSAAARSFRALRMADSAAAGLPRRWLRLRVQPRK